MKHRWLACLLLSAALALPACTPAEGGEDAGESAPAPANVYEDY
jgi:hypothetical protein